MNFLQSTWAISRAEFSLFQKFPKLWLAAIGVVLIPALYALIYLHSVRDPSAHLGDLPVALVNQDKGVVVRGQEVNMGLDIVKSLHEKKSFGFVAMTDLEAAKAEVRRGTLSFALVIPPDFSAKAVPGDFAAAGKLKVYVSEGNNYNTATLARRFGADLGHQVNIQLNEKRWSLVLSNAAGSADKMGQLHSGVHALRQGAQQLEGAIKRAGVGATALAQGSAALYAEVDHLTDGIHQMGGGLKAMDAGRPADKDLLLLKSGSTDLAAGHAALGQGLQGLYGGALKLEEGTIKLVEETSSIPLVGGKATDAATQLANGVGQLSSGIATVQKGQAQLSDGAVKLNTQVTKLADGVATLGSGIHGMVNKLPPDAKLDELDKGAQSAAQGAKTLGGAMVQLQAGSRELADGLGLLVTSLPKDLTKPGGDPLGLADSVEPEIEVVAPVPNSGAGFAPNFLASSLWLGAVMAAFLVHLRRLPVTVGQNASAPARLWGKLLPLGVIVVAQSVFISVVSIGVLDLPVLHPVDYALTLVTTAIAFLLIIVALTRAFGDVGKGLALLLMVLQLSSGGGVLPVELSGGVYQSISPWLPFTYAIKALRASMFGALEGGWLAAWRMIALSAPVMALCACYVGKWTLVDEPQYRPAMDI
jgi:putative membrane protein